MSAPTQISETLSPRIARIRTWLFEQAGSFVDRDLLWYRGMDLHREEPIGTRHGNAFAYVMEHLPLDITGDELIVGRILRRNMTTDEEAEQSGWGDMALNNERGKFISSLISDEARKSTEETRHSAGAMTGHMTPDYPTVLSKGLLTLRREAQSGLEWAENKEERDFYRSAIASLNGAMNFARRNAAYARELAETAEPERKQELLQIAEVCRRVSGWAPRTFHEAAQLIWFVHMWITIDVSSYHSCFCPGRVDQYLAPYYENDIKNGVLTHEQAHEILSCLFLKFNEWDAYSVPQTLFVGGQHADGTDATNPVSFMCLDACRELQMLNPALCVSWHKGIDRDLMRKTLDVLETGIGFPAIFNDEAIIPGLIADGATREDAVDYMAGSCVEISPIGASNPWVASGYVNSGKALERTVHRLADRENMSWADIVEEFKADLAEAVKYNVEITGAHEQGWKKTIRYPFLSCVVKDCIKRGTDITAGGARYNPTQPELVGLANVVDGLMAIKWACYENNAVSLKDLSDILQKDWEGEESLRRLMNTKPERYGNDQEEPDALWNELADFWHDTVRSYDNQRGGKYQPGFLCWIIHSIFGEKTGATPDGRKACTSLADSVGPVQGHDTEGVTAMLRSAGKMDHSRFLGGIVTNVKFTPDLFATEESREKLIDLLEGYLHMGGFELQINVVSRELLQEAQRTPEEHANLIVRVAGYSDYFTRLSRTLQDEIIARTEHAFG